MSKKQSSVSEIFHQFNLLSDKDFKSWMLNNKDRLEAMEKQQIIKNWIDGKENKAFGDNVFDDAEQYYNETYGE